MSTPGEFVGLQAERPAERVLFRALFDDAAVFAPRLAPLPQAVTEHVARQSCSYADLVGPLLLPVCAVEDFLHLERPPQIAVGLIGRPGADLALVADARSRLDEDPDVSLAGVEIGWSPGWGQALGWAVPLSVEVPRGSEQELALSDLHRRADDRHAVRAKFRTGPSPDSALPTPTPTPTPSPSPSPSPTELATFIRACVDHDLAFKLTGGLHHAIGHTSAEGEDRFGFLNVIAATRWALSHGAEVPEMESLLSQRDPLPILDIITRMSEADASVARAFLTAYGCCGVMDPIADLAILGLIDETTVGESI
jgi:hypothetical protein